ncbi:cell cycle transcriptional regulator TrcR [Thermaurantiacus sp.]
MANATQAQPLMPHATATWLVDNTSLTFQQIADFCQIHVLEVQAIADETAATRLTPRDPVRAGELTLEEIEKGQKDPSYRMRIIAGPATQRRTSGPRYTPIAKRQDKPDGIAWIIRNHPEITDSQISRLIGTTKATISAIRNREHWNMANISPKDPVTLGLCSQRELDALVAAAAKKAGIVAETDERLGSDRALMVEQLKAEREAAAREPATRPELDASNLFKPQARA